jgi:hypothetical protein
MQAALYTGARLYFKKALLPATTHMLIAIRVMVQALSRQASSATLSDQIHIRNRIVRTRLNAFRIFMRMR